MLDLMLNSNTIIFPTFIHVGEGGAIQFDSDRLLASIIRDIINSLCFCGLKALNLHLVFAL